jgi:diacylglycerol kinase family enzyme
MDICMMSPQAWLGAPSMAIRLFTGSLDTSLFMDTFRANDLVLRREEETPFHIDGDPVHMDKDVHIRIIPDGLKVLVEKRF